MRFTHLLWNYMYLWLLLHAFSIIACYQIIFFGYIYSNIMWMLECKAIYNCDYSLIWKGNIIFCKEERIRITNNILEILLLLTFVFREFVFSNEGQYFISYFFWYLLYKVSEHHETRVLKTKITALTLDREIKKTPFLK